MLVPSYSRRLVLILRYVSTFVRRLLNNGAEIRRRRGRRASR
jgi:hypothetical protein